jgi:hypothetical protein
VVSCQTPRLLNPQGKIPRCSLDRGLGFLRVDLDLVKKRKIVHCRQSNLGHPAYSRWRYYSSETSGSRRTTGCYNLDDCAFLTSVRTLNPTFITVFTRICILWRIDPLLSGDCKQRPFLSNDSVNTFPLQRIRTQQ